MNGICLNQTNSLYFNNTKKHTQMKLHELPVNEIFDELELFIMSDYTTTHLQDDGVKWECIQKFFERMEDIASLKGMTKQEIKRIMSVIEQIYDTILIEMISEELEEMCVGDELPF